MARQRKSAAPATSTAATVGYEAQLWQMADALREDTHCQYGVPRAGSLPPLLEDGST
jgi:hypothetical protein